MRWWSLSGDAASSGVVVGDLTYFSSRKVDAIHAIKQCERRFVGRWALAKVAASLGVGESCGVKADNSGLSADIKTVSIAAF